MSTKNHKFVKFVLNFSKKLRQTTVSFSLSGIIIVKGCEKMLKKATALLFLAAVLGACAPVNDDTAVLGPGELVTYASDAKSSADKKSPVSGDIVLGSFKTDFSKWASARNHNIKLASEKINGVVIHPGEQFSFNETLGPTSKEQGYKEAVIFVRGKEEKGYGGGICQVSSTLFNAADYAGMTIDERHSHSKEVSYVKPGRDAATSYKGIDFKFTNNLPYPVIIYSSCSETSVTASIFKA